MRWRGPRPRPARAARTPAAAPGTTEVAAQDPVDEGRPPPPTTARRDSTAARRRRADEVVGDRDGEEQGTVAKRANSWLPSRRAPGHHRLLAVEAGGDEPGNPLRSPPPATAAVVNRRTPPDRAPPSATRSSSARAVTRGGVQGDGTVHRQQVRAHRAARPPPGDRVGQERGCADRAVQDGHGAQSAEDPPPARGAAPPRRSARAPTAYRTSWVAPQRTKEGRDERLGRPAPPRRGPLDFSGAARGQAGVGARDRRPHQAGGPVVGAEGQGQHGGGQVGGLDDALLPGGAGTSSPR